MLSGEKWFVTHNKRCNMQYLLDELDANQGCGLPENTLGMGVGACFDTSGLCTKQEQIQML